VLQISKQGVHGLIADWRSLRKRFAELEPVVMQIRRDHPVMALRTIHGKLGATGIGRDRFEQHFMGLGLRVLARKNYRRTTDSRGVTRFDNLLASLSIVSIDQAWVSDITYFEVGDRFYYLTFIMDAFSRRILGYSASPTLSTEQTILPAIQMAIKLRRPLGKGVIFHSDGGGQYYSKVFLTLTAKHRMRNSMAENVYENAAAERLNGVIKNNYLVHRGIKSLKQLVKELDRCVKLYNQEKPHRGLNGQTPNDFEKQLAFFALEQKTEGDKVIYGKCRNRGASNPLIPGNKKPQDQNVSLENMVRG
jgi:transposase InsO family protein